MARAAPPKHLCMSRTAPQPCPPSLFAVSALSVGFAALLKGAARRGPSARVERKFRPRVSGTAPLFVFRLAGSERSYRCRIALGCDLTSRPPLFKEEKSAV